MDSDYSPGVSSNWIRYFLSRIERRLNVRSCFSVGGEFNFNSEEMFDTVGR